MNKFGHTIGLVAVAGLTIYANNKLGLGFNNLYLVIGVSIGSYLPDLDAEYSFIRAKIPLIPFIYSSIQETAKVSKVSNDIFKHRGALLHSWITAALFAILWLYTGFDALFGVMLGILGHHALDAPSKKGLRWFYPLKIRKKSK